MADEAERDYLHHFDMEMEAIIEENDGDELTHKQKLEAQWLATYQQLIRYKEEVRFSDCILASKFRRQHCKSLSSYHFLILARGLQRL